MRQSNFTNLLKAPLAWICLLSFWMGIAVSSGRCAKKRKTIVTVGGNPIRKIYIRSASADMTHAAAYRLTQDTCLTLVPTPKQADAILDVGIALPSPDGNQTVAAPDIFGPSIHPQTMGNLEKAPDRTVSATCSGDKSLSNCSGSSTTAAGDISNLPAMALPANSGMNLDVSLASTGVAIQELWEPEEHSKQSWSDQLRVATGCPVCPNENFDRRKYKSYRNWIQSKCPAAESH